MGGLPATASEWSSRAGRPHPGSSRAVGLSQPPPPVWGPFSRAEGHGGGRTGTPGARSLAVSGASGLSGLHLPRGGPPRGGDPGLGALVLSACPHGLDEGGP